jgi:PST family polysaccharide transporter
MNPANSGKRIYDLTSASPDVDRRASNGAYPALETAEAARDEHLCAEHLIPTLSSRAISGGFYTGAAQCARFVLNFASIAVLARLLPPEDFGLVAMVGAVTSFLGIFKDAGLSTATVQTHTITRQQVSNLFWINVTLSGGVALLSMAVAPLVARFYHESRITAIMIALSLSLVLAGCTVQPQAMLTRFLRLKALAAIDLAALLAGIVMGVSLAYAGLNYWALVAMQLTTPATALVLTWWVSGWRPALPRRNSGIGKFVRFGAHVTLGDLVGRFAIGTDSILVGRFFGPEPLGLYSRAAALLYRPMEQLLEPVQTVLIPVLSRLQSDPDRYRRVFLRALDLLALGTFPVAAVGFVVAEPIVLIVLGPQWKPAAPLFQAFALVALALPLSYATSWLLLSQGRGRDLLRMYMVMSAITIGSYLAGLPWGPQGIAIAYAGTSLLIRTPVLYRMVGQGGPVTAADLWKRSSSYLPCWVAAWLAATLALKTVADAAGLVQLAVCLPAGVIAGLAAGLVQKRSRSSMLYAWRIAAGRLGIGLL